MQIAAFAAFIEHPTERPTACVTPVGRCMPELRQFAPAGTGNSREPCARAGKHLSWSNRNLQNLQLDTAHQRSRRRGGVAQLCLGAPERSRGEERAKPGEGGTGGDTRGEFSSSGACCGAGHLGKPLEKVLDQPSFWRATPPQHPGSPPPGEGAPGPPRGTAQARPRKLTAI